MCLDVRDGVARGAQAGQHAHLAGNGRGGRGAAPRRSAVGSRGGEEPDGRRARVLDRAICRGGAGRG